MTALVTGATGFVGNAVARAVVETGEKTRVLARPETDRRLLLNLDVEVKTGDLRDYDSVVAATQGVQTVYHVAAMYKLWVRRKRYMYDCNVLGTEHVLEAAAASQVEKVVYTSSVATLGVSGDGTDGTEETPVSLLDMVGHYKRSKFIAEEKVLQAARRGLRVVVVNPSTPIGPRDVKPTPTGKMIVDFLNGKMYGYVDTGLNLVDIADVAKGHLLAAKKGRHGEKYILGNENHTLKDIFRLMAGLTGRPVPRVRVPYVMALAAAYVDAAFARVVPGREPFASPVAVKLSRKKMFFSPNKAVRELGLPQTPILGALREAIAWFEQNGYVRK